MKFIIISIFILYLIELNIINWTVGAIIKYNKLLILYSDLRCTCMLIFLLFETQKRFSIFKVDTFI